MPDIRPISDLRNHFKAVEQTIKETGGPIFFTQNGRAAFVLLSNEKYDRMAGTTPPPDEPPVDERKMLFASVVQDLMDCREMDEHALAEKSGLDAARLAQFTSGQDVPTEEEIKLLSSSLDVNEATLSLFMPKSDGLKPSLSQKFFSKLLSSITREM